MSSCKLDHPLEDVENKLGSQEEYLPKDVYSQCTVFLQSKPSQLELNELFHLLKKYDLASEEEKKMRDEKLKQLTRK
ncbi:group-specific protein [Alkalihalophilus pseudofirmus]|uniref:group-specific protein n=1 Tax=Alkalihalophilus pseudofirmus TaxID=79885 RepID=UPI0009513E18|nr:group-specific protein [Alkalihalophilus pseudofirmus]